MFITSLGKGLVNLPGDAVEFVGDIGDAVLHPIDTGKGLFDIAQGLSDKLVFGIGNAILGTEVPPTEKEQLVNGIGEHLKNEY
jgi:hypothetical protein